MKQVALHQSKIEEEGNDSQRQQRTNTYNLHREVALGAFYLSLCALLATHLLSGQSYSALNDTPRFDDTQDTGHGDTTNTDTLGIVREDQFRTHGAYGLSNLGIPLV